MSRRHPSRAALPAMLAVAAICLGGVSQGLDAAQASEVRARTAELEKLREQLQDLRDDLQSDIRKRDRLTASLRDAEKQEAAAAAQLQAIRGEQEDNETRRQRLETQRRQREQELSLEREALGRQLRAAYVSGRGERLKLLLNEQEPARLGRQMVYYDYFNRARNARIQAVLEKLAEIARLDAELAEVAERLAQLAAAAATELAARAEARQARSKVLTDIRERIEARGSEIAQLESEEAALDRLVRDLQALMQEFPVQGEQPFTALRGKLSWPVNGSLASDYGQPRAGNSIRWNGVVVAAPRGAPVRAVARGRITYADWLPGLGLLVILDHGDGYLSLYGHNDTINREVGDWVRPGDVVATVGESGGRRSPALYFEIRNGPRPENPHRWFGKPLKNR